MAILREGAQYGDKELTLETGRMAKQANGSVVAQFGDCMVLCTATAGGLRPDLPFFPLICDYQENFWAAGSIPGGYHKREGKPGSKATKTSRLIDRPVRPLFPDGYMYNTQIIAWVMSADKVYDTDVLAVTGGSAALMLSDIPWNGPVAAVRVGRLDGEFVAHPTFEQREESDMDLVLAARKDSIVMVEGEADEVPEPELIEALEFGHESVQDALDLQEQMAREVGKDPMDFESKARDEEIDADVEEICEDKIQSAIQIADKSERKETVEKIKQEAVAELQDSWEGHEDDIEEAVDDLKKDAMRTRVVETGQRIDGRDLDEVREVTCEVGLVPRAHGSALFTRGETQAIVTSTLGTERDQNRMDTLEGDFKKDFMFHYNFPPFCVGEAKPLRGAGRREIGHGMLAERALKPALPAQTEDNDFPYTVRLVSDILESNGSSSMASVCGGSLAMMDAGVPVEHATTGIAMGLIKEGDDVAILTDILGDEDHMGDMDFKITGTEEGVTAFQLDTKIEGLSRQLLSDALDQSRAGRMEILDEMNEALAAPRKDLSPNAPRMISIQIPKSEIGTIIGSGGKTIRAIQETTGTTVNVEDDGTVMIASTSAEGADQAIEIIEGLTEKPEEGKIYRGTVQTVVDFGAFIEILPETDGLCHISELTDGRVDKTEDVLQEGDECLVKVLNVEQKTGKIKLSRRAALEERGEDAEEELELD